MISNPNSKKSKTLNSKLVKILSVFRKTVPFSPLERAQTRIRFSSIAMRFGTSSHFVTIAPPEQDDLALLKLHLIRDNNNFNNKNTSTFNNTSNYKQSNLPNNIKDSPKNRLIIAQKYPA